MQPVYEEHLDSDLEWALTEGSRHFEEKSAVHETLRDIAHRLDELKIPYAIVGGMALFMHGFRRFTDVVDVLLTAEGLKAVHENLVGLGYVPVFEGSQNLRDVSHGVRIEFLVAGRFPGDGKPKSVAFPDPGATFVEKHGIRCLRLANLIEIKLASGMTSPGRLRDLADVQELIRHTGLGLEFAEQLDPWVREKYVELWKGVTEGQTESQTGPDAP